MSNKHVTLQEENEILKDVEKNQQEMATFKSRANAPKPGNDSSNDEEDFDEEFKTAAAPTKVKKDLYGNSNHRFSNRRLRAYDDDLSQDSDDEGSVMTTAGNISSYVNTKGDVVQNKPNPRFKNYSEVFKNLLKQSNVPTLWPICSMIITYDSTKAVTVTKKDDTTYFVKQYDLESYKMTFEEKIGGDPKSYIKLKEVEQSADGKKYAIVYNDDGVFFLRTFKKETRKDDEIQKDELNINKLLGLNNHTMCNQTFPDPFITCTFVSDDLIFINLFLNADFKHIHFLYDLKNRKI